jgi:predicted CoA-binding protein
MTTPEQIREIFKKYKNIAVYGMSKNREKPAHTVPAYLLLQGYTVIPINPSAEEILNRRCYPTLKAVEEDIDILNVFRPSDAAPGVVREAIERRRKRGDIAVIWLQEGIINDEARRLAKEAGITFIQDRCMYKEYRRLSQ